MRTFPVRSGLALAAVAAMVGVASPASASQVRCGNPNDLKVFLNIAEICFTGLGENQFNKVGVKRIETGAYGGVVKVPGRPDVPFEPRGVVRFNPPVNPTFINLYKIDRAPGVAQTP